MTVKGTLNTLQDLKTLMLTILIPIVLLPILYHVDGDVGRCGYAVCILIIFWLFEVLPLPVTSLLPVFLFPVVGVLKTGEVCAEYVKSPIMSIIGIFGVVAAMERWNLHKRITLRILLIFGTKSHWLIFGVLMSTAVLSMFITAGVTVLMIPIVRGIVDKLQNTQSTNDTEMEEKGNNGVSDEEETPLNDKNMNPVHKDEADRVFKALCLCISHGASIGSSATLTGHPANLVTVGLIEEFYRSYGLESKLSFVGWLVFAGPYVIILLGFTWVWYVIFFLGGKGLCRRSPVSEGMTAAEQRVEQHLRNEYKKLGPWSYPEIIVVILMLVLMILFITEDLYFVEGWDALFKTGFVSSSAPSILIMTLLFVIPSKSPLELWRQWKHIEGRKFAPLLRWEDLSRMVPWGILLLIGAAFALVKACMVSGLTAEAGTYFKTFAHLEPWLLTLVITALTTTLTEFISNGAAIIMMVPIVSQVAINAHLDPLALVFPLSIAANCAFMMPIATPPNAIAYSLGALTVADMASVGFLLNICSIFILNIGAQTWGKAYFRWDIMPEEMRQNGSVIQLGPSATHYFNHT